MTTKPTIFDQDYGQEYGSVRLTHHAQSSERRSSLRDRRGRVPKTPECIVIGHAWSEDPARHGGTICMVCQVVRWP